MDFIPRPLNHLFRTPAYLILWCIYGIADSLMKFNPKGEFSYAPLIAAVAYVLLSWQTWQRRSVGTWLTLALMMFSGLTLVNNVITGLGAGGANYPLMAGQTVLGIYFIMGGIHVYLNRPGADD